MRNILIVAAQGDPGGPAQSLGARHDAAAGGARPDAHLPRQRADRQCRACAPLDVVIVSLSSLTIFLLPLIALLISHDAIVGEMERGTMLLLLSYPVARWQVLLGKFVGHLVDPRLRDAAGLRRRRGRARWRPGAAIDAESWAAFASMIGSSILLGAAFIAVGYLVSALVRERGTAGGIAIGIWLCSC